LFLNSLLGSMLGEFDRAVEARVRCGFGAALVPLRNGPIDGQKRVERHAVFVIADYSDDAVCKTLRQLQPLFAGEFSHANVLCSGTCCW
jgi:hypothetical protein